METVADDYYARSLAVGEYRGVVTAIPDIARHTLHINLSAGLEPVAAECLAKMSRLFDPVSYTHLDVYKRQHQWALPLPKPWIW